MRPYLTILGKRVYILFPDDYGYRLQQEVLATYELKVDTFLNCFHHRNILPNIFTKTEAVFIFTYIVRHTQTKQRQKKKTQTKQRTSTPNESGHFVSSSECKLN